LRLMVPIFLRDQEDHPRIQARLEITRELLGLRCEQTLEYWSSGATRLERLWSLILLGDFASMYLAFQNGEDPTPVEVIDTLKARMRQF
ncbi:MAG TPA: SIS domain-containing protein, partial [Acidobacteriota bacterium]|nr:SIS domain-containing protein [Acidobacteriota bacterium]